MATPARRGADSPRDTPKAQMRLLVGVHDGGLSGINTYAEHVAAAASTAVSDVTLLVADEALAGDVAARLAGFDVRVVSLAMPAATAWEARRIRVSPAYAARRLTEAVRRALEDAADGYDAVHLNHPHLAVAMRSVAHRVCVAAWFHPHSLIGRMTATWDHSGRRFPKSAALALKGALHYRNDVRGYREADVVVAPTALLGAELRRRGINAVHCFPPARLLHDGGGTNTNRDARRPALLVCCGDLAHPRKNIALAIDALAILGASGMDADLELIGGNSDALASHIRRLPASIRVMAKGRLPAAQVHARMRAADALLFPSRFEEWGYVAVEAALHGTPSVTLPVYPFAEMLVPPLGVRAEGVTAREYADAIARILNDRPPRDAVAALAEDRFGVASTGRVLASVWSGAAALDAGARAAPTNEPSSPIARGRMSR